MSTEIHDICANYIIFTIIACDLIVNPPTMIIYIVNGIQLVYGRSTLKFNDGGEGKLFELKVKTDKI